MWPVTAQASRKGGLGADRSTRAAPTKVASPRLAERKRLGLRPAVRTAVTPAVQGGDHGGGETVSENLGVPHANHRHVPGPFPLSEAMLLLPNPAAPAAGLQAFHAAWLIPFLCANSIKQKRSTRAVRFCNEAGCPFKTVRRMSSCSSVGSFRQRASSTAWSWACRTA
jgi:hypothetical protein